MKKLLTFAFLTAILFSCSNSGTTNVPKVGQDTILGVYTLPSGEKIPSDLVRVIGKFTVTLQDGKKATVYDTAWGRPQGFYETDSITKKPKLDSSGVPKINRFYVAIGKDSVNTHIENISLSTLLKPSNRK